MSNSYPQIAQIYTDDNFKNQHNLQNQREKKQLVCHSERNEVKCGI